MRPAQTQSLFRTWWSTSANELTCGILLRGRPAYDLAGQLLNHEFEQHQRLHDPHLTALVSTMSEFLRVLRVAYSKAWDGEDLDHIVIAFLAGNDGSPAKFHSARELVLKSSSDEGEAKMHDQEYLFEWRIPGNNVIHNTYGLKKTGCAPHTCYTPSKIVCSKNGVNLVSW